MVVATGGGYTCGRLIVWRVVEVVSKCVGCIWVFYVALRELFMLVRPCCSGCWRSVPHLLAVVCCFRVDLVWSWFGRLELHYCPGVFSVLGDDCVLVLWRGSRVCCVSGVVVVGGVYTSGWLGMRCAFEVVSIGVECTRIIECASALRVYYVLRGRAAGGVDAPGLSYLLM